MLWRRLYTNENLSVSVSFDAFISQALLLTWFWPTRAQLIGDCIICMARFVPFSSRLWIRTRGHDTAPTMSHLQDSASKQLAVLQKRSI